MKTYLAVILLSIPAFSQGSLILNLSQDANFGGLNEAADGLGSGFTFSNTGATNAPISFGTGRVGAADFGPFTLTDTATGITQTFDSLSFVLTSTSTDIMRGGVGAVGVGNSTLINANQTLDISAITLGPTSDGSAPLFEFDGFESVFFNNTTAGETINVNGTDAVATATASGALLLDDPAVLVADLSATLPQTVSLVGVSGGVSLGGLEARFSLIPEPSSALLLFVLGIAVGLRRNRRVLEQ